MDDFAVTVEAGSGVVARWDAGVVVVGGAGETALDVMDALGAALGPEPTSGEFVKILRADSRFNSERTDLAAAITTPDGVRIFLRGAMEARTEHDERLTGPDPLERDLPGAWALWLGSGAPPTAQAHPVLDLRSGVVPGRGAVVHRVAASVAVPGPVAQAAPGAVPSATAGPEPAEPVGEVEIDPTAPGSVAAPKWPPPGGPGPAPLESDRPEDRLPPAPPVLEEPEPLPIRPFTSIDFGQVSQPRDPLPLAEQQGGDLDIRSSTEHVLGIRCSRGHFNNPRAAYCQLCGIAMVHLTHRLEPGPRPTLGFVVFADGATYALDRPYLLGRSPHPRPETGLTPLTTQDQSQSVSREHAQLRFDGWDVIYEDLGSTNGSFLWNQATRSWSQLTAGEPVVLASGTTISVGRMTFVYEAASKQIEAR